MDMILFSPIFSPICYLLYMSSPVTIVRRIATIVVDSINRVVFARTASHIGKKGSKIISPTCAYFYTSAAVMYKSLGVRIAASRLHGQPNIIFALPVESVFCLLLTEHFIMKTTAGARESLLEAIAGDYFGIATITNTSREMAFLIRCDEATESEANSGFHCFTQNSYVV
jgi:hypothetical protein